LGLEVDGGRGRFLFENAVGGVGAAAAEGTEASVWPVLAGLVGIGRAP